MYISQTTFTYRKISQNYVSNSWKYRGPPGRLHYSTFCTFRQTSLQILHDVTYCHIDSPRNTNASSDHFPKLRKCKCEPHLPLKQPGITESKNNRYKKMKVSDNKVPKQQLKFCECTLSSTASLTVRNTQAQHSLRRYGRSSATLKQKNEHQKAKQN